MMIKHWDHFLFSRVQVCFALLMLLCGGQMTQAAQERHVEKKTEADLLRFKKTGWVRYSDFGAKGDGKTDDIDAIVATHAFANQHGLTVKADDGASYYIGKKSATAIIQTDTDFGTASFIIDDTEVQDIKAPIFRVTSKLPPIEIKSIASLKKNQKKINISLPRPCLVTVTNSKVKHYIRLGLNQDKGASQIDIFLLDEKGRVDKETPIIWDFDHIDSIKAIPIDQKTLSIRGGRFTTIANKAESKYTYYNRNIMVNRSRVVIDGLEHRITGEGEHGAPYYGFVSIQDCAYVTVKNALFTGHKTYKTIGVTGKPVSMGSYDITANRALRVSFIHCKQTNDINDCKYWGVMASNYCKGLLYDHCSFSRFDAHKGVAHATIRNSTLGYMGINAIGCGVLTVENTTVYARSFINLRSDYGSTWQGEIIIRNCVFIPAGGARISASLINGLYSGQHNFGYTCYMPETITIENLKIDDSNHPKQYHGPTIFSDFNPQRDNASYHEKFPYVLTQKVILKNVTTTSGKKLRLSNNISMFEGVKIFR